MRTALYVNHCPILMDYQVPCDAPAPHDERWFDLERLIAQRQLVTYSYGRELFGGCLEPGYQEQERVELCECPECGRWRCEREDYERAEGGSLNSYYSLSCDACGFYETDADEDCGFYETDSDEDI